MKSKRHEKIVELVNKYEIETQEELAERLTRAGFKVTQATISRDIRELKLSKINTHDGKQKYIVLSRPGNDINDKYSRVLKAGFVSRGVATNMIVIRTVSGMAMAVAAALDAMNLDGLMGTIAGDDTIMCAIRNGDDTYNIVEKIDNILNNL